MSEKKNIYSDLINILKGRVPALPFVLHIVCRESYQIVYTTTIMDANQKADIFNTSLSILE